jgi:hypothetical protein
VEIFFNLLWVALSITLFCVWRLRRRQPQCGSLNTSTRTQLVALALLFVILFPVISLTDDLQARVNPAELEHMSRRTDLQNATDSPLHAVSVALEALLPFQQSPLLQPVAVLSPMRAFVSLSPGYLRTVGNRPPPAV